MIINKANCFLTLPPIELNVNDLLTKKLNTNAIDVDTKLAGIRSSPMPTNKNKTAKSSAVLATPTIPKRNFSACFLSNFSMIFLHKVERSLFRFVKDSSNILANHPKGQ